MRKCKQNITEPEHCMSSYYCCMSSEVFLHYLFLSFLTRFLIRNHVCIFEFIPWSCLAYSIIGQTSSMNILETLLDSSFINKNTITRITNGICLNADDKSVQWHWRGERKDGSTFILGNRDTCIHGKQKSLDWRKEILQQNRLLWWKTSTYCKVPERIGSLFLFLKNEAACASWSSQ